MPQNSFSRESAHRHTDTHTHTQRCDSMTSTADVGGNEAEMGVGYYSLEGFQCALGQVIVSHLLCLFSGQFDAMSFNQAVTLTV